MAKSDAAKSGTATYQEVEASPEFAELRSMFRKKVWTLLAIGLGWYFIYVLMAAYATDFMATKLIGNTFNVAMLLGLSQFVMTFAITTIYAKWADNEFDPAAASVAAQMDGGN